MIVNCSPVRNTLACAVIMSLSALHCAHAAQLVKIEPTASSKNAQKSVYESRGLQPSQLEPVESMSIDGGVLVRFAQYFDGHPIYGAHITAELGVHDSVDGNAYSAAVRGLLSGYQAFDVEKSQNKSWIEMDKNQAFAIAKVGLSQPILNLDREFADPYIYIDQAGLARAVFLVVVSGTTKLGDFRTSTLLDRTSGSIIDQWDSLDKNDGNGPGQLLKPVKTSLAAFGWSEDKIINLMHHAQKMYWADNTDMSQSACGADRAALDLGYDVAQVKQAFNVAGKCRSNRRSFQISAPEPDALALQQTDYAPAPISKAVGSVSYGPFTRLQHADMMKLSNLGSGRAVVLRADTALGYSFWDPKYVQQVFINDNVYSVLGRSTAGKTCEQQDTCVSGRLSRTITKDTVDALSGWITWPGTSSQTEASSQYSVSFPRELRWGKQTQTSDTTISTVQVLQQLKGTVSFSDALGAEYSITYSDSMATSNTDTVTTAESFYSPAFRIPAYCTAKVTLKYRFKLAKREYDIKTDLSGWIRMYVRNDFTQQYFTEALTAEDYFKPWEGVTAYKASQTSKESLETKVEILAYKTSTPGTSCTVTYL
jgi:hypothetical protein